MVPSAFFGALRSGALFPRGLEQGQVDGINAIMDAADRHPVDDRYLAYMLATAYHETAFTMQPVLETRQLSEKVNPSVDEAIRRLDRSWADGKLPWVKQAYWRKNAAGKSWLGRGLVQLTFETNYRKLGDMIGVDLVANPDLALRTDIAVRIMFEGMINGAFTGKRLAEYFTGTVTDFVGARRIINGTDRAQLIAGYAKSFAAAIEGSR